MGSTEQPLRAVEVRGPLMTDRLALRPFEPDDLPEVALYEEPPEVARCLQRPAPAPGELARALADRIGNTRLERSGDRLDLAIDLGGVGDGLSGVIGEISLELIDRHDRQGRISCVVRPDAQGSGYALEASTRVLEVAFTEVGLHRVVTRFDSRCAGAAALATRLGMRREGRLVHDLRVGERWVDTDIFGILDVEWAARKSIDGL
jgi:RimJ/RimL family protein N-acetyltransferase